MMRHLLRMVRVSSFGTAPSDVLAGFVIVGGVVSAQSGWLLTALCVASMLLYWGGLVLNDLLDYEQDREHRPGRALAAGDVSRPVAVAVLVVCFGGALALAFAQGSAVGWAATSVMAAVILYDVLLKSNDFAAAAGMGLCRALNLAVGMIAAGGLASLAGAAPALLLYFVYIAALTIVGRSETRTHVDTRLRVASAVAALSPLLLVVLLWSVLPIAHGSDSVPVYAVPPIILCLLLWRGRAAMLRSENLARAAGLWVRDGVLGIVLYNSGALLAGGAYVLGICVALLFVVALALSKRFSPS